MQTPSDSLLKAIGAAIGDQAGKVFASLCGKIDDEIEQRIKELPQPQQGPPGPPGATGNDGKDGAPGEQGIAGSTGADGKPGKDGDRGADGLAGEPGKDGRDGIDGAKGNDGANGKDGADGRDGIDGKDGAPGLDGKNGADGLNGKDGPPIDIEALAASVTQKVLSQIPAPIPGADGKDGSSVDLDAVRVLVAGEVNKAVSALPKPEPGRDGRPGIAGTAGLNGKDAADIDPLDGIDDSSAYPRGTWASYKGQGLIYAYRTTDPIVNGDLRSAGWRVVVDGIVDVVESSGSDERTIVTTHLFASGKAIVNSRKSYQQIHRHVWKEDREYERGDTVTHAGSTWHAEKTSKGERPATGHAWVLMTKRGSDGRDLNGARQ